MISLIWLLGGLFILLPFQVAHAQSGQPQAQKECMMAGHYTPLFPDIYSLMHVSSADGKTHLFYDMLSTTEYKVLKEHGEVLSFSDESSAKAKLISLSPSDLPKIAIDHKNGKIHIETISGTHEFFIAEAGWLSRPDYLFSQDQSTLVFRRSKWPDTKSNDKMIELTVIDLKKKTQRIIPVPEVSERYWNQEDLHPQGKEILFWGKNNGERFQVNLEDGTKKKIEVYDWKYDEKGRLCRLEDVTTYWESKAPTIGQHAKEFVCLDGRAGKKLVVPCHINGQNIFDVRSLNGDRVLLYKNSGENRFATILTYKEICSDKVQVDCGCDVPKISGAGVPGMSDIKAISLETLCKADAETSKVSAAELAKQWDKLTGPVKPSLTEAEGLLWLKRLAKPEGLNIDEHLGLMRGLIEAGFAKAYPDDMAAALSNLTAKSEYLFENLMAKYPQILDIKLGKNPQVCRSEKDKEKIKLGIYNFVDKKYKFLFRPKFEELGSLAWLVNLNLDDTQKESLAATGAFGLTESTADSNEGRDIFPSKIYKFSYHNLKKLFNLPYRDLTDMTLRREGDKLFLTKLTLDSSGGNSRSKQVAGGFGVENVEEISVSNVENAKNLAVEKRWEYKGKTYRTKIDLKMEEFNKSIVTTKAGPDYSSMWKDGEFRTVVVAGANLGGHLTESTMGQYISYYTSQGFEMGTPSDIDNFPKYLESKTKAKGKGQMDVFIKEAHSDGDEKNLFRISEKAKIVIGKKKTPKGEELVEIIYPVPSSSVQLSNREFGEWMQKRDAEGGGELLYLNSSCWSKSKAVYEVGAAATDKLLNIPTTTTMQVFYDHPKNPMRITLDSIRNGKNFSDIRTNLKEDEGFSSGKKNKFIFPDEEDYKSQITKVVAKPLNVKMEMEQSEGSSWSPYSIEDH